MAFSTRIFDSLVNNNREVLSKKFRWTDADIKRYRQLLRLASLLHDVGHAPFSHASEDSFESNLAHEDYTRKVILESEIAEIIDSRAGEEDGISAKDVAAFFSNTGKIKPSVAFLSPIFAGEVDSDKMDYLLRDSLYAGVSYGRYDHERLIESLCLIESPVEDGNLIIAVREGGVHSLEALVLARYFMFTQVYFHKVARAYHLHFSQFLRETGFKYPISVDKYLLWDDNEMIKFMKERRSSNRHAERLLLRDHYKLAFKSSEHTDKDEYKRTEKVEKAVAAHFDETEVLSDRPEKASHKFDKIDFYVHCDDGSDKLINNYSEIISRLQMIDQFRVYCDKSLRLAVQNFCREQS